MSLDRDRHVIDMVKKLSIDAGHQLAIDAFKAAQLTLVFEIDPY